MLDVPSNSSVKLRFCEISFIHDIHISCKVVFKFCTEHGNITAVLCTFGNDCSYSSVQVGMTKSQLVDYTQVRYGQTIFLVNQCSFGPDL